ncbi:MAG: M13 family metallopeptidase [Bdellovibrionaceae bacterium]|nr:M13 family metallopeptidase [Pseudobdellovibrionaceae bacterium]
MATATAASSEIPERRDFPISPELSPCEDFHKYVCSKVESSFTLRPDRSSHTFAFNDSFERILEKKKSFFKNIAKEKSLNPRGQQLKDFYLACMDENANKSEEKKVVKEIIQELEKIDSIDKLIQLDRENLKKGKYSLLILDSSANADNPDKYDAYIANSFMNLPDHSYYEKPELVKDFKALLQAFFKTIFPKMTEKELAEKVDKMYLFETQFVAKYPKAAERRQRWSEKRDLPQTKVITDFPRLKIKELFELIPKDVNVRVNIPEALTFLNDSLIAENLATLKDIYLYKSASGLMDDGYPEYFKKKFAFNKKFLGGPEIRPVRQERCTLRMMAEFEKEVDEVLMDRLFPNFPKDKMVEISEKIRSSILNGIDKNKWLSKDSKKTAQAKIKDCRLQIIAPTNDKEWNFNPIQKYSAKNPIENTRLLRVAQLQKVLKEMGEPVNKDAWAMGPLTINAYYSPTENKFVMPMGILQFPFFDANGSLYENLGAVGAVMGHELGHGIDDQGSKFDEKGKLNQWMSMKDLAEFQKRGERMVNQFEKIGHNGKLTLGENVADLVGLSFAYQAAFGDKQGNKEEKQKFFIAYARTWCEVARPGVIEKKLKTDPHALGWARINEQVKHQPGFQEAFSCKAGQAMTLSDSDRISIW